MSGTQETALAPGELQTVEELRMHKTLRASAPPLDAAFLRHLPRARAVILRRLIAALWREDVAAIRTTGRRGDSGAEPWLAHVQPGRWLVHDLDGATALAFPLRAEHAFDRVQAGSPVLGVRAGQATPIASPGDLVALLAGCDHVPAWRSFGDELADSVANLALAYARSEARGVALRRAAARLGAPDALALAPQVASGEAGEDVTLFFERLNTEGHNLHPCGRSRLGMRPVDVLCHDLESAAPTQLILTGVLREYVESTPDQQGRDVGQVLLDEYPRLETAVREHCRAHRLDPGAYLFLPVHAWQLDHVVGPLFSDEIAGRAVVPVPAARLAGVPTSSVRTLLTGRSPAGRRLLVKTALDVLIGSTRRSISAHTTNNGPLYSRLLRQIVDREPALAGRVVLLEELAGASYSASGPDQERRARALSALVREDIGAVVRPGELPVPGCALASRSPVTGSSLLAELLARYAWVRGQPDLPRAGLAFAREYAALLLPVSLILMTKYGIAIEAHLQNAVPTFVDGVPSRLVLRDWGGLRIYPPRLRQQGLRLELRPGTVTVTDDLQVMQAKMLYTVLANHLGEVITHLVARCGVEERAAWRRVRDVLETLLEGLDADPALREHVAADRAALFAPALPTKAFVGMRLDPTAGDQFVPVRNPLHES